MEPAPHVKRGITRQLSGESPRRNGKLAFRRNLSFNPRLSNAIRFNFGRQSSLDPKRGSRSPCEEVLTVPGNLDSTMQLLFLACQGDAKGVEELLKDGVDVNSIDLDGRTALHIAACEAEGHADVVKMLLSWRVNVDARDRWGSTYSVIFNPLSKLENSYHHDVKPSNMLLDADMEPKFADFALDNKRAAQIA